MSRFGIAAITLHGTQYPGTRGYQLDRGIEVDSEGSDGVVYETAHHVIQKRPMADLTSLSLKTVIAALNGSSDIPVLALNGSTGLVMYGQKASSSGPGFAGSTVHATKTGLRGLIYASGVRWSRGSKAELGLRAMFKSADGTTDCVTDGTAALPTQPTPDFGFALTALTIAGVSIPTVNSLDLEFDPKAEHEYTTGLPEPTDVICAGVTGRMSHVLRADVGDIDLGSGTGSCSAVFTQYAHGGGFGSASVTFTLNSAWSVEEGWGGDGKMARRLLVRTKHDGSTRPLTWSST